MRHCPKCGKTSPDDSANCVACGLNLEVLYLPYPLLALLVILGFRMVQAMEAALLTPGFGPKVVLLAACCLLGTLAFALAQRRFWASYLAYVIAIIAGLFALRAFLQNGQDHQSFRLLGESLYMLGYLIFSKQAKTS